MFLGVFGSQNSNLSFLLSKEGIFINIIYALYQESHFKKVINTDYVIRSKSCDNPDKHILINKMNVRFEFGELKNQ